MKNEATKQEAEVSRLRSELAQKEERVAQLEKQAAVEKNETRVLSQKKCKDCEHLKQKEKEHFELNEKYKKLTKQE